MIAAFGMASDCDVAVVAKNLDPKAKTMIVNRREEW